MRDLYHRYFSKRRPPEPAAPQPDDPALEAQIRAAFPPAALSDALQARVAETCRAAAAPEAQAAGRTARNRRLWMQAAGWGTVGLVVAAVMIIPTLQSARERASWQIAGLARVAQRPQAPGPGSSLPGFGTLVPHYPNALVPRRPAGRMPAHVDTRVRQDYDGAYVAGRLGGPRAADAPAPTVKSEPITTTASQPDRYLIRNATLTLQVRDARQAARALTAAVRGAGGYVSDSHDAVDDLGQRSAEITVRVPAGRFDGSLARIEALGKVMEKQVTAEDVTEEFVDSQARLRNLQETEQRLRDHLGHAGRLPDILLVERELTRVRGQIEQLQGRLRYLQHRIDYSTLDVTLSEAPRPQSVVPPAGYSGRKVAADAMRSLVAFGQALWSGAIWLAVWAIVWLPVSAMGWVAMRRRT